MQLASHGVGAQMAAQHERVIRDAWLRCVYEHRLEPTCVQEVIIQPQSCRMPKS
jgi:hypothetical protein